MVQGFLMGFKLVDGKNFGVGEDGGFGGMPHGKKILKSGPLRMHVQHYGAKLEFLNRTQTSLNFGFFIQQQHMNTLFFKFSSSCQ